MSSSATTPLFDSRAGMLEAQRLGVYRCVAPLAQGRRVLDVTCGAGHGGALLAQAGAREVVRVDLMSALAGAEVGGAPSGAAADRGERGRLPQADGFFGLVVAIGQAVGTHRADTVLEELLRVTASDGFLLISTTDGNRAEALRERLLVRFHEVSRARCHYLLGSGIEFRDRMHDGPNWDLEAQVLPESSSGAGEVFLLAGGSHPGELPSVARLEAATLALGWIESWKVRRDVEKTLRGRVRELEQRLAERDQLQDRLRSAQRALDARTATRDGAVQEAAAETAANFEATLGWRLTAPLRRAVPSVVRRHRPH